MKYAVGVDVGGTSVKMGLVSESGDIRTTHSFPTDLSDGGANIIPDVAGEVASLLIKEGITREMTAGVGIGVPGPVTSDGTVNRCVNLGWGRINIKEELEKRLERAFPVFAANDANAATLGEVWLGAGRGCGNACLITVGTGIGAGMVCEGRMIYGAFGASGELGHITYKPGESRLCTCGKRGCVEQYASATGIMHMAKEAGLSCAGDVKEIYDAARNGNPDALRVTRNAADALGFAMSCASAAADPEVFIIGGGVSGAGAILMEQLEESFSRYVFHASRDARIVLAALGNDAGIYGCAKMVFDGINLR
ncbi:MAG: ROK family protein [Eubacterium sp.]|nr:ROK family protein [Eubacterium sp.]